MAFSALCKPSRSLQVTGSASFCPQTKMSDLLAAKRPTSSRVSAVVPRCCLYASVVRKRLVDRRGRAGGFTEDFEAKGTLDGFTGADFKVESSTACPPYAPQSI